VPAAEILLATTRVRELVEDKDRTREIPDAIAQGHVAYGMQTFDQSLMGLYRSGLVSYEEALRQATNPDDFALRVSGISGTSDSKWDTFEQSAEAGPGRAAPARSTPSRPAAPATPAVPAVPIGRVAARPGEAPAVPASSADDDFQIERF
jgi:twitching motility protein PilT